MAAKTNHWKLGLFVVLGVCVGLGALGWLGADKLDRKVERFEMYFDEPVDGLSIGSEVRYRGMPIGSVSRLSAAPDKMHVQVESQILVGTLVALGIRDPKETKVDVDARVRRMRDGVDGRVLRAQIERNPLTGMAVINVDFYEKGVFPLPKLPFKVDEAQLMPTRPSQIKDILATIENVGRSVPGIIKEFHALTARVEKALDDLRIQETGEAVRDTLTDLRKAMNDLQLSRLSGEAMSTMTDLRTTLDEVRAMSAEVRKPDSNLNKLLARYEALGADVQRTIREVKPGETMASARETMAAARKTMRSVTEASDEGTLLVSDLRRELITVIQTLDAFRRLADLLERDPSALLRGKTVTKLKSMGEK